VNDERGGEWLGTQLEHATGDGKTEQEETRGSMFIALLAVLLAAIVVVGLIAGAVR
jgi:hypothetical protein